MRQPGAIAEVEELVDERTPQIEIDKCNALAHACEGDREVRDGGRLAFGLNRAGDHDRAGVHIEVNDLKILPQRAKSLGLTAERITPHDEPVAVPQLARRLRHTGEQGKSERLAN